MKPQRAGRGPGLGDAMQGGAGMMADPMDPLDGLGMGMMGPNPEEALAEWITAQLDRGPIDHLELRQTGARGEACVRDWASDELAGQDPQSLAGDVYGVATDDASSAASVTRYCLCCYRPGEVSYKSRYFFRVSPADLDSAFETEQPDAQGLVGQAHRHLEGFARLALGSMNSVVRGLQIQNAEKDRALREHTQLQLQTLKLQQEILDRTAERDIRNLKARRNLDLQNTVIGRAMSFGEGWLRQNYPQLAAAPAAGALTAGAAGAFVKADEVGQLDKVCLSVAADLAQVDDDTWSMALAQLPQEARGPMKRARAVIQEAQAEGRTELTAEEGAIVQATRTHIIGLMLTLSDQAFAALLAEIGEASREPLSKFRALVRARAQAAQASATNGAAGASTNGAAS